MTTFISNQQISFSYCKQQFKENINYQNPLSGIYNFHFYIINGLFYSNCNTAPSEHAYLKQNCRFPAIKKKKKNNHNDWMLIGTFYPGSISHHHGRIQPCQYLSLSKHNSHKLGKFYALIADDLACRQAVTGHRSIQVKW